MTTTNESTKGKETMKYLSSTFGEKPFTLKEAEEAFIADREARRIPNRSIAEFQADLQEILQSGALAYDEETDTYTAKQ